MKRRKKEKINIMERNSALDYVILVLLGLFAIICIFPFYQTLLVAFSSEEAYGANPLYLLPYSFDLTAFKVVFQDSKFLVALLVTIGNTVVGTFLSLVVNISGAYVLSKKDLIGVKFFGFLVTFFMLISAPLIPTYLNIQSLGLYDSLWVYIFPTLVVFYYMLLMRNFFLEVPKELLEAAKLDGANELTILTKVVLPIAKPFVATFALFIAVDRWNEWYTSNIYIKTPDYFTLQYYLKTTLAGMNASLGALAEQLIQSGVEMDVAHDAALRSASILVAALPIICVYPFVQKYLIKGMTAGSVKG